MTDFRLRNHIPIASPATREPFTGDEPDLRVSLGFTPRWYHQRLGIDFSEKWHIDPIYRYETLLEMKKYLAEHFPTVSYFQPQLKDGVEKSCATISGVHGALLISLIYGLEVTYSVDNWPSAHPDKPLPRDQIEKLEPFDLESNPAVQQLLSQMDVIQEKWGQIHGYLNYQGVLNNALRIRGSNLFMDMYDEPEFVHHLFDHVADTMIRTVKLIQERQRKSGFYINLLSNSNCVLNMISPDQYEKFLLQYDVKMSQAFERFGIHTCNWNASNYLEVLRKIPKMGYLDMGMNSDLEKMRELYPKTRKAIMYSPVNLEEKTLEDIRADIFRIYQSIGSCDIVMADVECTTPDQRVNDFLKICQDILDG